MRVAPRETTKPIGSASNQTTSCGVEAGQSSPLQLPIFTFIEHVFYEFTQGDKVAGIDRSSSRTESGLRVVHTCDIMVDMNPVSSTTFSESLAYISAQVITQVSIYVPRILGALLILLIGAAVAKAIKKVVVKVLERMMVAKILTNTPVEHFFKNAEFSEKLEEVVGSIVYWLLMLVVLHTCISVLGLEPLSAVLDRILEYIPRIIAAILVLFFGVLLAGVVESVVKGAIKSIDGKSSRLLGKVASYMVVTITVMAAISELGIASDFIMILFVGFVGMLAIGTGLAVGLGGQDVVRKMLNTWYERTLQDIKEDKE